MNQPDLAAIILAAGQSTRMKSQLSKMLHPVCGRPIIRYVTDLVAAVGAGRTVMVLGHQADRIKKELSKAPSDTRELSYTKAPSDTRELSYTKVPSDTRELSYTKVPSDTREITSIEFVYQKEQLGTAHAISQTRDILSGFSGTVLILNGDAPLLTMREVTGLIEFHHQSQAACTILSTDVPDPFGYGRILRDEEGRVLGIVEERDASEKEREIKEINSGMYCFDSRTLYDFLNKVDNRNKKKEYYLTDLIAILRQEGKVVQALKAANYQAALGINTRMDLAEANRIMRQRILTRLMQEGVTLIDPNNTYVDFDVRIEQDTVVWPGCVIEGGSSIGKGCHIGPFSRITGAVLGDRVYLEGGCLVIDTTLAAGLKVSAKSGGGLVGNIFSITT